MLQQGKSFDALRAAERAKARVLFDMLQRGSEPVDEQFLAGCKPPTLHPTGLGFFFIENSSLLIYTVTPEQTFLFVLKIAATAPEIHTFAIPITAQELRQRARLFHQQIAARRPAFAAEARDLYRLLLQPAAAALQGVEGLCIRLVGSAVPSVTDQHRTLCVGGLRDPVCAVAECVSHTG